MTRDAAVHVERIDHVHVEVADRALAALWYGAVLGLQRSIALGVWAEDPMGPMILETIDGLPVLSLFARGCAPPSRDCTIAFRVTGAAFLAFRAALDGLKLRQKSGAPLGPEDAQDHDLSWSFYFVDPDGNPLELTTYDYDTVEAVIRG